MKILDSVIYAVLEPCFWIVREEDVYTFDRLRTERTGFLRTDPFFMHFPVTGSRRPVFLQR